VDDRRRIERDEELRLAAASGLMALTGRRDGPPLSPPAGMVGGLQALTGAIGRWSAELGHAVEPSWTEVVTERAALLGLGRDGRRSCGGTCRLLRATDGWVAVNLARPDDREAVDAIVGAAPGAPGAAGDDPWRALADAAATRPADAFVARVRLLGVPGAVLGERLAASSAAACTGHHRWPRAGRRRLDDLMVVDLSSMWAGPLTAKVLADAGAQVTKVESTTRPDGARAEPAFYRRLHRADQPEVQVDLATDIGRSRLRSLVEDADVVIESSRPRALEQLGVGPGDVAVRDGRVWISITGYGREVPGRDWVAFGDDAAVAGGLVAWETDSVPAFCADAVADPVTGLTAAAVAMEALAKGGGELLDVSMAGCSRALLDPSTSGADRASALARPTAGGGWHLMVGQGDVPVVEPRIAAGGD
jgi:hypothetical protein